MARAVEDHWSGPPEQLGGLVVTRYGYGVPCRRIEIVEAAHPVPDAAGLKAAERLLQLVQGLTSEDLVLCLISGDGSALLPLPLPGLTLEHKQAVNRALLASGANISEMNCVRRHLSAIKGGRLAAACHPARVLTLLISDVPGDNPIDIASGPTVADPTTCADALVIVRRYGIEPPPPVLDALEHVPVRQWVLSLPIPLRLLLAAQPKLVTPVLQVARDHAPPARAGRSKGRRGRQRRSHADPALRVDCQPQHPPSLPGAGRRVPAQRRRRAGLRRSTRANR